MRDKGKMDSNLFVGPHCVVSSCCGGDHLVCYDSCMNCVNMLLSVHKQTVPLPLFLWSAFYFMPWHHINMRTKTVS